MDQSMMFQAIAKFRQIIAEHGHMVMVVGDGDFFHYTVGLSALNLPELMIACLPPLTGKQILNDAATAMKTNAICPVDGGGIWPDIANVATQYRLLPAEVIEVNMVQHYNVYGRFPTRAFQLFWPDPADHFPWDSGYDRKRFPSQGWWQQ